MSRYIALRDGITLSYLAVQYFLSTEDIRMRLRILRSKSFRPPRSMPSRFSSRVSGNGGQIPLAQASDGAGNPSEPFPFITAEIGGGVQDTYRRRPVITTDDVGAMCPVFLGSGVNLFGVYLFQGGENPQGKLSTLQESKATGYPTDVPVKSYDFQAPLSEFGEERASFRRLKLFTYFLDDFGAYLAPMSVHAPEIVPNGPSDISVPRISVRSSGDSGFLFVNNYARNFKLPERDAFQVSIKVPKRTIRIPAKPVNIPSGAYFIWPFNLEMSGIRVKYSTAQLFTKIVTKDGTDYFFFAVPGIRAEFDFDAKSVSTIDTALPVSNFRGLSLF